MRVKEFFCRGLFGGALVSRFLDVDDFRQALKIQQRLGLGDLQVFRALALYHYKNKNETEQLIIEDKGRVPIFIEVEFYPLAVRMHLWINFRLNDFLENIL